MKSNSSRTKLFGALAYNLTTFVTVSKMRNPLRKRVYRSSVLSKYICRLFDSIIMLG